MSIDEVISAAYRYGSSRRFESEERSDKRMSTLRTAIEQYVAEAVARERDEARAEIERLITEVERLRGRLIGKRAIFQAGRDSYKTNCQPMNTDDEAWAEFVVSQEAKP